MGSPRAVGPSKAPAFVETQVSACATRAEPRRSWWLPSSPPCRYTGLPSGATNHCQESERRRTLAWEPGFRHGHRLSVQPSSTSLLPLLLPPPPEAGGSDGKESACNEGDLTWAGKIPGGGQGSPLQYSCLENPCGQRSLAGYSPWGRKESDTTERLSTSEWLCAQCFLPTPYRVRASRPGV